MITRDQRARWFSSRRRSPENGIGSFYAEDAFDPHRVDASRLLRRPAHIDFYRRRDDIAPAAVLSFPARPPAASSDGI